MILYLRVHFCLWAMTLLIASSALVGGCSFSDDDDEVDISDILGDDDDDDDITIPDDDDAAPDWVDDREHPFLMITPEQKSLVLSRADDPAYAPFFENMRKRASDPYEPGDPEVWKHGEEGHNAQIAMANAYLAYVFEEDEAGVKAADFLLKMRTDFENNDYWDVNIRLPDVIFPYCAAYDMLMGAGIHLDENQAQQVRANIVEVVQEFFDAYLNNEGMYRVMLHPTQNNHNIRTASDIAYAALTFPYDAEQYGWTDFAFSELNYMFSYHGHYLYEDGGVAEGQLYWMFALDGAFPVFMAMDNMGLDSIDINHDCRLRYDANQWLDHGCVEDEPITFNNPLRSDLLRKSIEYFIRTRLPSGSRQPIDDGTFGKPEYIKLFTSVYENASDFAWHWEYGTYGAKRTDGNGYDNILAPVWYDASVPATQPSWPPTQFLPYDGHAVFRSGWDTDAVWLTLTGEFGDSRKTLHDHIDNGHIQVAAYGEYLAMDTGYHKPNAADNAVTAHAANHSLVLVDGMGAPLKKRGLNVGGEDTFMENMYDGLWFDYAEARTPYSRHDVEWTRQTLFVRDRYFVIADTLDANAQHDYTWRLHGNGGYDSGGSFEPIAGGAGGRYERPLAGLDVYVANTAGAVLAEAPETDESPDETTQNVRIHKFTGDVLHHYVLDANATGEDASFLAALYPYRVGAANGEEAPAEIAQLASPQGTAAYRIVSGDGTVDIAIVNDTGGEVTVTLEDATTIATNGRFALAGGIGSGAPIAFVVRGDLLAIDGAPMSLTGSAASFSSSE